MDLGADRRAGWNFYCHAALAEIVIRTGHLFLVAALTTVPGDFE